MQQQHCAVGPANGRVRICSEPFGDIRPFSSDAVEGCAAVLPYVNASTVSKCVGEHVILNAWNPGDEF